MNYSKLAKTWFIDFDGTMVTHRGKDTNFGKDILLPNVKEFFERIEETDTIVITTARRSEEVIGISQFMRENRLPYHHILANLPTGARVIVNDIKPSGYQTAYAVNLIRDSGIDLEQIDTVIKL